MRCFPSACRALWPTSACLLLAGCAGPATEERPEYTLTRDAWGVPQIVAASDEGVAQGVGFSVAEDHLCAAMDLVITVNGERALSFGPDGRNSNGIPNLHSDIAQRLLNDDEAVERWIAAQPAHLVAMLDAYAAGFNAGAERLRAAGAASACLEASWLRPIDARDLVRLLRQYTMTLGIASPAMAAGLAGAWPPDHTSAHALTAPAQPVSAAPDPPPHGFSASNAIALGGAVTANGRGMLLANPHLANFGESRLSMLQVHRPGHYEVSGSAFIGMPLPIVGFNRQVAFTGTISRAVRLTLFVLELAPDDPEVYLVDGERERMGRREIRVPVRESDGTLREHLHVIYETRYGPVINLPGGLGWDRERAFAIRDANRDNPGLLMELEGYARADSVAALHESQRRLLGNPWLQMTAADMHGQVYLGNLGPVPRVDEAMLAACVPQPFRNRLAEVGLYPPRPGALVILDGARSDCDWGSHPDAPRPGIFAADELPWAIRDDYLQNANDSSWLSHQGSPLAGYPLLAQREPAPAWWRTTTALDWLGARLHPDALARQGGVAPEELWALLFDFRVRAAELHLDEMLEVCTDEVSLVAACDILRGWDRSASRDSGGYLLFERAWLALAEEESLFTAFVPDLPLRSDRRMRIEDPVVRQRIRTALDAAMASLLADGLAADAAVGEVQFFLRGGTPIPFPGGPENTGIYNRVDTIPWAAGGSGRRQVLGGPTHIQVVYFAEDGPRDRSVLAHAQATEPARAPHTDDQARLFSVGEWLRLAR